MMVVLGGGPQQSNDGTRPGSNISHDRSFKFCAAQDNIVGDQFREPGPNLFNTVNNFPHHILGIRDGKEGLEGNDKSTCLSYNGRRRGYIDPKEVELILQELLRTKDIFPYRL